MTTRSAAERRAAARDAHRRAMAACPTHRVLDRLSDKWVSLIFKELVDGPKRHSQLARAVAGASQKMLTQTLRRMERDGLVARDVTGTVPPQVDYRLTRLGESLEPALRAITVWAERHIAEIDEARSRYDGLAAES